MVTGRLDVIADLAAHQQHLTEDPPPDHTVLLALPPPVLCTPGFLSANEIPRQVRPRI